MKGLGILGALVALVGLFWAWQMNVSIDSSYGRFNNLGLMADRQNYLIASCAGLIVSVLLIGFGSITGSKSSSAEDDYKCPFCAELVKKQAIICRFCGKELPENVAPIYPSTQLGLLSAIRDADISVVTRILNDRPELVNLPDHEYDTPLHKAAMSGHLEVCQKLLELGADKKLINRIGRTPSNIAQAYKFEEIALLLA